MKDIISYFEFFQLLLSLFKKLYRGVLSNFYITAFFKCPFTLLVVVSRVFTNSFVLLLLAEEVMNREFLLLKIYLISQCFFFSFLAVYPVIILFSLLSTAFLCSRWPHLILSSLLSLWIQKFSQKYNDTIFMVSVLCGTM